MVITYFCNPKLPLTVNEGVLACGTPLTSEQGGLSGLLEFLECSLHWQ